MIELESKQGIIEVPTTLDEVVKKLPAIVKNINVAKHHCVICIAERTNMYNLKLAIKEKVAEIIPIIAKWNIEEDVWSFNVGDTIICDSFAIERATHIYSPLSVSKSSIISYFKNMDINRLQSVSLSKPNAKDSKENKTEYTSKDICYTLSFKIIPITEIKGTIPFNKGLSDVFIKINSK